MTSQTLDTALVKRMVAADAISGAQIIGQAGGWSVLIRIGAQQQALGVQRSQRPRLWRSLDSCVAYLRNELHIARIDLLDATHFSAAPSPEKSRPDAAQRMRKAFEATEHDQWFRAQVAQAIAEADAPDAEWLSADEADASWADKARQYAAQAAQAQASGRKA